jgi:hypothetical protein
VSSQNRAEVRWPPQLCPGIAGWTVHNRVRPRCICIRPGAAGFVPGLASGQGLTDKLTIQVYIPFVERITLNTVVGEETGFKFFEADAVTGLSIR